MNVTIEFAMKLLAEFEKMEEYFKQHAPMEYQAFKNEQSSEPPIDLNIYELEGRN